MYLALAVVHADIPDGTTVVTCYERSSLRYGGLTYDDLSSCSQEEADGHCYFTQQTV